MLCNSTAFLMGLEIRSLKPVSGDHAQGGLSVEERLLSSLQCTVALIYSSRIVTLSPILTYVTPIPVLLSPCLIIMSSLPLLCLFRTLKLLL